MLPFKSILREWLIALSLDITKNLRYDRLTRKILKTSLHSTSNCVDIGANKGEFTKYMLKYAPNGNHLAFEPLPHLYAQLNKTYPQVKVYDYALSDKIDQVTFNHVTNAEEYSGLKIRKYNISNPIIQQIQVKTAPLDDFVTSPIDFIKIDVEGAEYSVLKGAAKTLEKYAPLLIFEFGQGASEYYGTNPIDLFHFLVKDHRYHIFTLKEFIDNKTSLSLTQFISHYENNSEYYFVASKSIS